MKFEGTIHKYGDHINTDVIIPARYCNTIDPRELALHCLEDLDRDFVRRVQAGDILVAGENFGCGSSREVAPLALQARGIACIIARSFARIFYRNAVNIGLPLVECGQLVGRVKSGDRLLVDFQRGKIYHGGSAYNFGSESGVIQQIVQAGGLVNFVRLQER
jgi:3-isopropylmalate/(R)-2-methylmalate dehydratase small subunit